MHPVSTEMSIPSNHSVTRLVVPDESLSDFGQVTSDTLSHTFTDVGCLSSIQDEPSASNLASDIQRLTDSSPIKDTNVDKCITAKDGKSLKVRVLNA